MGSRTLLVLGLTMVVGGCAQDRQLQQDMVDYKNESGLTLQLLIDQNGFLNSKIERVRGEVEDVVEADRRFQYNFNVYSRRPDEIKLEILEEVGVRAELNEEQQAEFSADYSLRLQELQNELNDRRNLKISEMQAILDHEDMFFRFVYTDQDSVNNEFATRFDKKPWYQSLLGGWEENQDDSEPDSN